MKTFLHYTKEKELDEGIGSFMKGAAGFVGGAVRGVAKGLDAAQQVAGDFEKGGLLGAARGSAGRAIEKAEKENEESGQLDAALNDAYDDVENYKRKLAKARTAEDRNYYQDKLDAAKDRLRALGKAKSPKDFAMQNKKAMADRAQQIRSRIP